MRNSPLLRWGILVVILAVVFVVGVGRARRPRTTDRELLREARRAILKEDFALAESLALAATKSRRADPWAWMVAGEAAVYAHRYTSARQHYEQVTSGDSQLRSSAAHGCAEASLLLGDWQRAEREYQRALEIEPKNLMTQRRLADLYNLSGRRHRAVPIMVQLIGTPHGTLEDLFYLGDVDHAVSLPDTIHAKSGEPTADPLIQLALGVESLAENRYEPACLAFALAFEARPDDADVAAGWGQALVLLNSENVPAWWERVPPTSRNDGGVWAVLGQWAEQAQRNHDAVHAYAWAASQRPQSRIAWHRLGLSLSRVGRTDEATLALERAQQLQQLALWLDDLFQHRQQTELIRRVVMQLAAIGRTVEAAAWTQYALQIAPQTPWARTVSSTLRQSPQPLFDSQGEQALIDLLARLIQEQQPDSMTTSPRTAAAPTKSLTDANASTFHFVDEAHFTGLDFVHHSARDPNTPGARIIETTGGGVGVIDYDADGWPDLCFPQGAARFPVPPDHTDGDRLFRNRDGQTWDDVSDFVGINDRAFGQGISAGDFDNDGFADLYIANYGVNRLLHNQGDGTFQDVTPAAMKLLPVWTTSCVIADLNGDGLPDLFDVTYCRGEDVSTRICEQAGQPRSCSPRAFGAETDRLWLSNGAGEWKLSVDNGLDLPDGLGLGVVAFRPTPGDPLTLFIANDEAPNYWLIPQANTVKQKFSWEDHGLVGGLAVDADGKPQACMGVACDDLDGNGLLDLYVTNFYQESNTFYAAVNTEYFDDRTRSTGLREPSWNQLGFGTQSLDVDLDSWPDLIVANGHIDDLRASGQPFLMPIQFFHNRTGRFVETQNTVPLPMALGRGMARLDWNRDGREDLVITNQDSPAALLTNATPSPGRSVRLQFRATNSARDAIGTIVRLRLGERILTRQLTAGDGYMASNERQLVIGIGDADHIDALDIFWPSGIHQECGPMESSRTYMAVETRIPIHLDHFR